VNPTQSPALGLRWAARIRAWSAGGELRDARKILATKPLAARSHDVYCFFDNTDAKLRAPFDAQTLMRRWAPSRRHSRKVVTSFRARTLRASSRAHAF
jgi:uncharacterized protein YecE (DUF72 family)